MEFISYVELSEWFLLFFGGGVGCIFNIHFVDVVFVFCEPCGDGDV